MKYHELHELGSEKAVKEAGKYRQEGKNYVVNDADVIFFKCAHQPLPASYHARRSMLPCMSSPPPSYHTTLCQPCTPFAWFLLLECNMWSPSPPPSHPLSVVGCRFNVTADKKK